MSPSRSRGNRPKGETPAVHPLLSFQFDADARPAEPSAKSKARAARRAARAAEPSSIRDAIVRWLDEQL